MSFPTPLLIGSIIYASIAAGLILLAYVARLAGQLSKENLGYVLSIGDNSFIARQSGPI